MSEITRDKVTGESEVMQWRQVLCNTGCLGGVEDKKGGHTALSGPFKRVCIERHDHSVHTSSVLQVQ